MNLEDIKLLFEAHLNPVQKDIKELKEGQLQLIEIIKIQTRHDEAIVNLKKDVDECSGCVKKIKENGSNKVWDIVKIGCAGIFGGLLSKLL